MKLARFLMPMGEVTVTAENQQAADEFARLIVKGDVPWMTISEPTGRERNQPDSKE